MCLCLLSLPEGPGSLLTLQLRPHHDPSAGGARSHMANILVTPTCLT